MSGFHAKITLDMIERTRSRFGQVFKPREPYYNLEATRDTIRHFIRGIGDSNPLWIDDAYAEKTRYGCIAAPPCFLYSVYWPDAKGACFPGIHGWHAGNDWEFFRPIRLNDSFDVSDKITDLVEKKSNMARRTFIGYCETTFTNQNGQVAAVAKGWNVFAERDASKGSGKYSEITRTTYSQEDLKKIENDYDREEIRGAKPRYWEDVKVGDELTPVVKGPLSMADIICWLMGGGTPYLKAHGFALAYRRRHPKIQMDGKDVVEAVHFDEGTAQEVGINYAYDYGAQRISWLGHLLTNWIGDDGFLKRLQAKLVGFNVVGDTTWCKGKVIKKYEIEEECYVDCQVWGENQRKKMTVSGKATIVLPSKDKKNWPLDRRI